MEFKAAYERWKRGEAAPEEAELVEAELEKYRLLTDHVAGEEDPALPPEPDPAQRGAYRKARRAARRRSAWIVALSVALACALVLGGAAAYRQWVLPWLNTQVYYDPNARTLWEGTSDLTVAVSSLAELTTPGWSAGEVEAETLGAGRYRLTLGGWSLPDGEQEKSFGTLDKGVFQFEERPFAQLINAFCYDVYPFQYFAPALEEVLPGLEALPEYVRVRAAVSFGRDLSMDELAALAGRHPELELGWVGVRAAQRDLQRLPLVGFKYHRAGVLFEINEQYPNFSLESGELADGAALERHFKSLLQFQADHPQLVNPLFSADPDIQMHRYFQERLDYVEEHGVKTYGVYVSGTPAELVRLCGEEPDVCGLNVRKLWLALPQA